MRGRIEVFSSNGPSDRLYRRTRIPLRPVRCRSRSGIRGEGVAYVLARLPCSRDDTASDVGGGVSGRALLPDVLFQLLDGLAIADNRAHLECRQLPPFVIRQGVLANVTALDVDSRARHLVFFASRISAGLFPLIPCGSAQRPVLPAADHSTMGQLPRSRVCMENDSWQRRGAEHTPSIHASDTSPSRIPALQSVRGGTHTHTHLYTFYVPANLCGAGAYSTKPGGSVARSRGFAAADVLARDPPTLDSGRACRRHFRIRAQPRRLPRTRAAGRSERHY